MVEPAKKRYIVKVRKTSDIQTKDTKPIELKSTDSKPKQRNKSIERKPIEFQDDNVILTFGKFKGQTFKYLYEEEAPYCKWFLNANSEPKDHLSGTFKPNPQGEQLIKYIQSRMFESGINMMDFGAQYKKIGYFKSQKKTPYKPKAKLLTYDTLSQKHKDMVDARRKERIDLSKVNFLDI